MPATLKLMLVAPLVPVALAAAVLTAPVWTLVVLLFDAVRADGYPRTQFALLCLATLANEALGLVEAVALGVARPAMTRDRWLDRNYALQRRWVRRILGVLWWLYDLRFDLPAPPPADTPVVLLARHTGAADTLLPFLLLDAERPARPRYVLKHELLWGPCLNLVGRRLPNAFVRRGTNAPEVEAARIGRLAETLSAGDTLVVYPEGTRFTSAKRTRLLRRLEAAGDPHRLAEAQALRHVLPLRELGIGAVLAAAPQATVVFVAHTGLEGVSLSASLLARALRGTTIRVTTASFSPDERPTATEETASWLRARWRDVDAEVARLQTAA
ncbi:MAG: 1-acyl-sn-glycerol-3-phosphate acyltransferase [Myxococcales bacterium]|nr:1-acyl-sn-glycerol-3-phosphate acyltransferase [Myxococcales bacterium]MCB9521378.1 1-acyl-sn-glycerol-3-phosphate acyltransferase [Myxococcales bacterium]MCB9532553.1 1-acyl-sn-glycerol-3-phosphate acyltransferase [Myxococcales bacterium]MCB9533789.1 1-acyl-sn-glycerol-3-phosphate acyltransferase [Myxococcales bacterium]